MGFHSGGWWAFMSHDERQGRPAVSRSLLSRVWDFARPYRFRVLALLLTILVITGLSLVPPLLLKELIDSALPNQDLQQLNRLALALIAVPLVSGLFGVAQRRLSAAVGEGVIYDLRRSLYDHMLRMSLRFFTRTRTGELMSRLNNDVVGAQRAVTGTMISIVSNLITLISVLAIMFLIEWRLTLLGLSILPLFILPARRVARRLRAIRRRSMELNAEMNASMNETLNISGAMLVKLFGREKREKQRFGADARRVRDIGIESAVVGQWFMLGLTLVGAVGTAMVYWGGGRLVLNGAFTIGTLVAFSAYLGQLYGPLIALTNAPVEFAQSMVSFERVFEALDIPIEIQQKDDAIELDEVTGSIKFDQVSFSYLEGEGGGLAEITRFGWGADRSALLKRGKQGNGNAPDPESQEVRWALTDVTFEIKQGQLVALVGPSGAGKTTITYLIPRLYDPSEGRVLLDGYDLRDLTLATLAGKVGMVTQDTFLFYDTIRANLLYARQDATEEEIIIAAKAANIHDFIVDLPNGYDTVVGERGYRLSGGERQRMAIARVILKDPQILVLDEATSHLDSLSEALIQEALKRVMQGRTSLVIAHRLSTILAADLILVMDQGRLVERGTHEELMNKGGLYTSLYETQFSHSLDTGEPGDVREATDEEVNSESVPLSR